jgi:hypothetical protein
MSSSSIPSSLMSIPSSLMSMEWRRRMSMSLSNVAMLSSNVAKWKEAQSVSGDEFESEGCIAFPWSRNARETLIEMNVHKEDGW